MLKIIRADLYKSFHRPYVFVLTGCICALALMFVMMFPANSPTESALHFSLTFIAFLPFFAVMAVEVILAEENKFGTLKNTISFGIARELFFIAKSISCIIITAFCAAISLLVFSGALFVHSRPGKAFTGAFITDYAERIGITLLLVAGAVFIAILMSVIFKKSSVYAFSFAGILLIPTLVFKGLAHYAIPQAFYLYEATIFGQVNDLASLPASHFYEPILVAVLHIVVFGIAGIIIFRRQEIK